MAALPEGQLASVGEGDEGKGRIGHDFFWGGGGDGRPPPNVSSMAAPLPTSAGALPDGQLPVGEGVGGGGRIGRYLLILPPSPPPFLPPSPTNANGNKNYFFVALLAGQASSVRCLGVACVFFTFNVVSMCGCVEVFCLLGPLQK